MDSLTLNQLTITYTEPGENYLIFYAGTLLIILAAYIIQFAVKKFPL